MKKPEEGPMSTEHFQQQLEHANQMTVAIREAIIASSPQVGRSVGINFPVVMQALFNAVVSIAAIDPDLSSKSAVREFADNARNFLIRAIRAEQSRPERAQLVALAQKAVIGPDGEMVLVNDAPGEVLQ